MPTPFLIPGLLIVLAVWCWPHWQPEPWVCLAGAAVCALLSLPCRVRRLGIWAGAWWLGCAAPGLVPEGPALRGHAAVAGLVMSTSGHRADIELSELDGAPASGRLRLIFPEAPPPPGRRVRAFGRGTTPWRPALPGAPDPALEAATARIRSRLLVSDFIVLGAPPDRCADFAGTRREGLLRALACGDRAGVSPEVDALLTRTGTRHLLSVSGLHVGLVAGALGALSWSLLRGLALLWPGGGLRWLQALVASAAAWGFAGLTGWSVSAQRAAVMVSLVAMARASGREAPPWNLLAIAAAWVALTEPAAVRGASFQLSFGAVAGILLLTPRVTRLLPPDTARPLVWLVGGLAATLGATAGTLPVAAWVFQELPLLSPIANLPAVVLAQVIVPLAVGARAGLPLLGPAELLLDGLLAWLTWLDTSALAWLGLRAAPTLHPAVGPLGALGLALALLRVHEILDCFCLSFLALGLSSRPPAGLLRASYLDVGQGDAALVEDGGKRLLIDGGPGALGPLRYLRRRGLRRLDAVVLSHPHPDHMRGLEAVLAELEIGALWLPRLPLEGEEGFSALVDRARRRGIPLRLPGDPGLEVLAPTPELLELAGGEVNETSLVVAITRGRTRALFTGDIEAEGEAALRGRVGPISWLKVPHHGSSTSSGPRLLRSLAPRVAVFSCGVDNRYGHPDPEVLFRYAPALRLRTDRRGTVQLQSDGNRETWRVFRYGSGWSPRRPIPAARAAPRVPTPPPLPPPRDLLEAAYRGDRELVEHFLSSGARPSYTSPTGDTALSLAVEGGHLEIARRLYALGAPFGRRDPVCTAARYARLDVLEWLIDLGLPLDRSGYGGNGPLHMAVLSRGHGAEVLSLLLAAGADPRALNGRGQSPLELAEGEPIRARVLREVLGISPSPGAAPADASPPASAPPGPSSPPATPPTPPGQSAAGRPRRG